MQAEIANRLVALIEAWDKRDKTFSDTLKLLTERVDALERKEGTSGVATYPITIPATGWQRNLDDTTGYTCFIDIANEDIKSDMTPFLTILRESLSVAGAVGLCPTVAALDGAVRIYSASIPAKEISASLAVFGVAGSIETLPIATKTQRGVVKLGDGLVGEADGTANVDFDANIINKEEGDTIATQSDVENMIHDVINN